jgi:hypothetical protein
VQVFFMELLEASHARFVARDLFLPLQQLCARFVPEVHLPIPQRRRAQHARLGRIAAVVLLPLVQREPTHWLRLLSVQIARQDISVVVQPRLVLNALLENSHQRLV